MLFKIKIRRENKWVIVDRTYDSGEALNMYNSSPVPRMLVVDGDGYHNKIVHKQYSDNGFIYVGSK